MFMRIYVYRLGRRRHWKLLQQLHSSGRKVLEVVIWVAIWLSFQDRDAGAREHEVYYQVYYTVWTPMSSGRSGSKFSGGSNIKSCHLEHPLVNYGKQQQTMANEGGLQSIEAVAVCASVLNEDAAHILLQENFPSDDHPPLWCTRLRQTQHAGVLSTISQCTPGDTTRRTRRRSQQCSLWHWIRLDATNCVLHREALQ